MKRRIVKNRQMVALRGLTIASAKMYFRNRSAMFFSLFFPLLIIFIFGSVFKNTTTTLHIDVSNQSKSELAANFESAIKKVTVFKVKDVSEDQAKTDLNKGDADLTVTIPANFGQVRNGRLAPAPVTAHYNGSKPGNGQAGAQIIQQLASAFNDQITHTPKIITVDASGVKTKDLTYIDFLLPGMVGLSIMQIGIFSVAFAFVSYKSTGMLRRLQATPTRPSWFLAAQGTTRLFMAVLQATLLTAVGMMFFGFHLSAASWPAFLVLAILGSIVFQEIGFAIAGWAKNEDQAQPVAQLIQFPMMFLSGTFFPRETFPQVLQTVTAYLPLTYLADALRQVANNQASLWAVRGDILGLAIWAVIAGVIAVRLFHWE